MTLTSEQQKAVDNLGAHEQAIMIAPTGAGKTAIILHHIANCGHKFLVAAPPKVVPNWPNEAEKWGMDLKVLALTGGADERIAEMKAHGDADVLVISLNLLDWLLREASDLHGCTAIVVDELSKAAGKQTAKLRQRACRHITHRIGMTATPVSENFEKLFAMTRAVDNGQALGTSKEKYLNTYFYAKDFKGYSWALHQDADKLIMDKIKHLIVDVEYSKTDELPPKEEIELTFDMPASTRKIYDKMRKDMLHEHEDGSETVAVNMAVLSSKLRQIASGFSITETKTGRKRDPKEYDIERALTALKWAMDLDGQRGVIIYEYDHQRIQMERIFSDYANVSYTVACGETDTLKAIDKFKKRKAQLLIAQQNTLSHGVDGLQKVCAHLLFFQPIWSADTVEQAIGRVWRQGQSRPVTVTFLICEDTIDDVVLTRVESKGENMKKFLKHLRGQ